MDVIAGPDAPPGIEASERVQDAMANSSDAVRIGPASTVDVDDESRELRPAWCLLAAPVAIGLAIAALIVAAGANGPTATQVVGAILVAVWAATGVALGVRRRQDRLGPIVLSRCRGRRGPVPCAGARGERGHDQRPRRRGGAAHPRTAPGVRPPPVRRLARRSTDERRPASRRGRRLCRQPHHRCSTVHRPRLDPRLADRDAVGGRVLRRRSRRLLPLSERRGHRPSPDPMARVGAHRGGRGHPRDDGAAAAHRVAARPRHRRRSR